jgi:glutathione synthase/RimK-type ligase-like ATP-grasp enzyme
MKQVNSIKIAIHHSPSSFSDQWIEYCKNNNVQYRIVNCYGNDIIKQLKDCGGLMWHWHHYDAKAVLFARQLIYSLEMMGLKVFPDSNTCWHFDDKVGQKYLLEAVDAPFVSSYIFYDKHETMEWIAQTDFPKVFKLRGGGGSSNVRLVRTKQQAIKLCEQAFGKGFKPVAGYFSDYKSRVRKINNMSVLMEKLKKLPLNLYHIYTANRLMQREKGYIYFQDFVPRNEFDTRIIVIGDKAFGIRRYVRKNDFRASGSGLIEYEKKFIDERCVLEVFKLSEKLKTQSLACDCLVQNNEIKIVEISYAYMGRAYDKCVGYWDRNMNWHSGHFKVEDLIIEMFINELRAK